MSIQQHFDSGNTDPLKKRLRPKVYAVGLYVVGIFILIQVTALVSIFWFRQTVIETHGPTLKLEAKQNKPTIPIEDVSIPDLPPPQVEGRLEVSTPPTPEMQITQLTAEAYEFRRNGNYTLAQAALSKAMEIDPKHPLVLSNFALLEEARDNNNAALDYWRQVIQLGDVAEGTIQLARERAVILERRLRMEEERRLQERLVAQGQKLVLAKVETEPSPLGSQATNIQRDFILERLTAATSDIVPGKLTIRVYYYEKADGDRLVPARIQASFLNNPPNWNVNERETLRTNYELTAESKQAGREYYGYLLRIYYDGVLQIEQAEPKGLLKLMPASPR